MEGVNRVLYRLPALLKTKTEGRAIFICEGEKDCEALLSLGLCSTCNPGGAGKWEGGYTNALTGAKVVIIADRDEPGRKHAALVARELTGKATSVQVVELPDRSGHKVKDGANWVAAGGTVEELREVVRNVQAGHTPRQDTTEHTAATPDTKPAVILPHGAQSISDSGRALGELLAKTERFFIRGGNVVKLSRESDGLPKLDDVKPATLASDFESIAALYRQDGTNEDGSPILRPVTCSESAAKLIAASSAFREVMPPISVLTRCPVLIERAGSLIQIAGYDRQSGIYAAGKPAETMDAKEASRLLWEVVEGFRFATPADRARALAALLTPAFVFGGLLRGRAPIDLGEADDSQSGKGYRLKLTTAIYAQGVRTITQQKAGVGSLEESFNTALIRGANFISLDNIRGRIDSPAFESFLTEEVYFARMPYREPVEIDPRRVVIMLTSNNAAMTTDLSNRSSCVRILKQKAGFTFKVYPAGDILEHVQANQHRYLGAVFSIIKAWYDAGRPRTTESRHDFRPWAQTLDWITQNLLEAGPLLDGHRETQARMTNPVLGWLREVAIEVIRAKQAGAWLRAGDIVDLIAETGIETPGLPEHGDLTDHETRKATQQSTGRRLGLCFKGGDTMVIDGMIIDRREQYEAEGRYTSKEYRITLAADELDSLPASHAPTTPPPHPNTPAQGEIDLCGWSAADGAADDSADKTLIAADAANTSLYGKHFDHEQGNGGVNICSMGPLAATAANTPPKLSPDQAALIWVELNENPMPIPSFEEEGL